MEISISGVPLVGTVVSDVLAGVTRTAGSSVRWSRAICSVSCNERVDFTRAPAKWFVGVSDQAARHDRPTVLFLVASRASALKIKTKTIRTRAAPHAMRCQSSYGEIAYW